VTETIWPIKENTFIEKGFPIPILSFGYIKERCVQDPDLIIVLCTVYCLSVFREILHLAIEVKVLIINVFKA
jgi:hypothetical protein